MKIYTKNLSDSLWSDFEKYFEFNGKCSGCWCMNHRLPLGLDFEGEAAKLAMKQLIQSNRVFGILAYAECDDTPIGWCSVDRRKSLPGHDCIGEDIDCEKDIWSIHCNTVREDYKNKGIQKILAEAACNLVKELNGKKIEAYPEPSSDPEKNFSTWNIFNGHQSTYEDIGFQKIERNYGEHSKFYFPMFKTIK